MVPQQQQQQQREAMEGIKADPQRAAAPKPGDNNVIDLFDLTDSEDEGPVRSVASLHTEVPRSRPAVAQAQQQQQKKPPAPQNIISCATQPSLTKNDTHVSNSNEDLIDRVKKKSSKRKHHETTDGSSKPKKKKRNKHKVHNEGDKSTSSSQRKQQEHTVVEIQSTNTAPSGSTQPQQGMEHSVLTSVIIAGSGQAVHKKRKKRKTRVLEVSIPTETEAVLYGHKGLVVLSEQITEMKLYKKNTWKLLHPRPCRRSLRKSDPLTVRISLRNRDGPLLICYDHVEPATEATKRYAYKPPTFVRSNHSLSKVPFRHVLFLSPVREGITPRASSPTPLSTHFTFDDDDRPHLKEWFPHDPQEYILSATEQELAWLFEESHHCFRGTQEETLEWDFVWEYCSPGLRVELRKFEDDDDQRKFDNLVRWEDTLVKARMKVVQNYIRFLLNIGFRRLHMKSVVAVLRLVQPKDKQGRRTYPMPDFEAAAKQRYPYFSRLQQDRKRRQKPRPSAVAAAARTTGGV